MPKRGPCPEQPARRPVSTVLTGTQGGHAGNGTHRQGRDLHPAPYGRESLGDPRFLVFSLIKGGSGLCLTGLQRRDTRHTGFPKL